MKEVFIMIGAILGSLLAGGWISWFYIIKIKKPKNIETAIAALAGSKANDEKRDKLRKAIEAQIAENKRLRDELEEKLKK